MKLSLKSIALIAGLLGTVAGQAKAEIVTYNFTGQITSIDIDGTPIGLPAGIASLATGQTITGSLSWDMSAAVTSVGSAGSATWARYATGTISATLPDNTIIGPIAANPAFYGLTVYNDYSSDYIDLLVANSPLTYALNLRLFDSTKTIFSSSALPNSLSLSSFDSNLGYVIGFGQRGSEVAYFQITSLEAVGAVPEPSTWAMMIVGFAGVGFMTYRRRKAAALAA